MDLRNVIDTFLNSLGFICGDIKITGLQGFDELRMGVLILFFLFGSGHGPR